MIKMLLLATMLVFSFEADAVVKKSVSKALSYRNIANDKSFSRAQSSTKKTAVINKKKTTEATVTKPVVLPTTEYVNMKYVDSTSVSMSVNDEVEISLIEEDGYSWDFNPDTSRLKQTSNTKNDKTRIVKYKLTGYADSYIYFDYVNNETDKVEKTKQLTVNLRL